MLSFEVRVRAAVSDEAWQRAEFVRCAAEELANQKHAALRAGIIAAAKERRIAERRERVEQRRLLEIMSAEQARFRVCEYAEKQF